jgi:hypothetical protein
MQHPDYQQVLRVGCICAGKMEDDPEEALKRESNMKSRAGKRKRWLNRKWKISTKGNEYIITDGFVITIFYSSGELRACVKEKDGDRKVLSRRKYKTLNEIKLASFDCVTRLLSEQERS